MKRVLVLCTGNSCRSQMAEGYLRFYSNGAIEVHSAGLQETALHPTTVRVMEEDNIDMSEHEPKGIHTFRNQRFDYLITVCKVAEEDTLQTVSYGRRIHYDIPDPEKAEGSEQEVEQEFLWVRELVKRNMLKFLGGILSENIETA